VNRRILKKLCKQAVPVLVDRYGFAADAFHPAAGDEAIDAPRGIEPRHQSHGFLHPGPLRGTPLLWERTSWEYEEWDCRLPSEVLADCRFWETFEPTAGDLA
jgi:hypothetical protein